jgi:phosphatidate cytidylyltransferase
VWWFAAFLWTFRYPTAVPAIVRWAAGVLVIVPLFVALYTLLRLGIEYLVFTLLIVWVADGGAYFVGKSVGRVKLAPAISPGKTWEGVGGGFVLVAALAIAVALWRDISVAVMLPFCLAVAAISIVGDLTVSMFKRTVGVKDSGTLFPGHGGILDRIDSVAAAAPLFVLGLTTLGLV